MTANKKIRIMTAISAVCLILILIIATVVANLDYHDFKNSTYIFNTVEDLNFLNDRVVKENVTDKKSGNLSYNASRSIQVEYNGNDYTLFAYEFNSQEDVFTYGKAVTGNDYSNVYEKFGSTGWSYFKYVAIVIIPVSDKMFVYNGNNVLYVEAKISKKQFNKFIDYLFTNLPQKVEILSY